MSCWHSTQARGEEVTALWRLPLALLASISCCSLGKVLRLRGLVSKLVKTKWTGGGGWGETGPGHRALINEHNDISKGQAGSY